MIDIFCVLIAILWGEIENIVLALFPRQIFDSSLMWKFYPEAAVKRLVKKYGSVNSAITELLK